MTMRIGLTLNASRYDYRPIVAPAAALQPSASRCTLEDWLMARLRRPMTAPLWRWHRADCAAAPRCRGIDTMHDFKQGE
jgi:hypothetical protein